MALFNIVLVPLTDYPLLLVEEKERDTLSLLSRSGVSLTHFALSKAGACLVVGELMAVVVFLIAGASHTGKTALARRLVEQYKANCLSIDHLKWA